MYCRGLAAHRRSAGPARLSESTAGPVEASPSPNDTRLFSPERSTSARGAQARGKHGEAMIHEPRRGSRMGGRLLSLGEMALPDSGRARLLPSRGRTSALFGNATLLPSLLHCPSRPPARQEPRPPRITQSYFDSQAGTTMWKGAKHLARMTFRPMSSATCEPSADLAYW